VYHGPVPLLVVDQATIMCSMSQKPSKLVVLDPHRRGVGHQRAATVADHVPMKNVQPFGPCMSPAFPPTAAAHAPQPCVPNTRSPWAPGSAVTMIGNHRALVATDTCRCEWGGTISIVDPGQTLVSDT